MDNYNFSDYLCATNQTHIDLYKAYIKNKGCDTYCIFELAFLAFTGITLPFYLLVLFILIYYRTELKSSFFTICISAGVADIVYTIFKYAFQVLPYWLWYDQTIDNQYMATIAKMGHWGVYYAQVFGVVLMVINRFSAIVYPLTYSQFWSGLKISFAICLQWILPILIIFPMLVSFMLYVIAPSQLTWFGVNTTDVLSYYSCSFTPTMRNTKLYGIYQLFSVIFEPMLILLVLVLHIVMVLALAHTKHTSMIQSKTVSETFKTELKLAFTGFVITIIYSSMVLLLTLQYLGVSHWFIGYGFYYFSDTFTAINPFLLLLCSVTLRQRFMKTVCCIRVKKLEIEDNDSSCKMKLLPTNTTNVLVQSKTESG